MIPTHRTPEHPGEILLEEFLRPLAMSQTALSAEPPDPLISPTTLLSFSALRASAMT